MLYLFLNLTFMLIAFVVLNVFVRKTPWRILSFTLLGMLLLTTVFDNIIIGLKIVDYDQTKLCGWFLGLAPIEDFAYTVVSVLAVATIWNKLTGKKDERD
jgi:lycopene cyclase domain-containing protein